METSNKTKVLFLITKSNWGGAQRYVYDLATTLPSDHYEVTVALGGDGPLIQKLETAGIKIIQIPGLQRDISFKKELLSSWHIAQLIRAEDPDIFHVNSSKAGFIGACLGRLLGVPRVIFTAHGWAFNEDRSTMSKLLVGWFHWITILFSHVTIAVSHGMKAQMTWPGTERKMIVVHPGRTITNFTDRTAARTEVATYVPALAEHANDTWIGTVAELHPIKRLHRAIDAVATLITTHPQLRYVIVSDGELKDSLQKQIDALDLTNHVFLTGAIPEAARLLKAFDIFTLPSKSESYGYVLVEAGQAALPVVSTKTGGITDLITNNKNGLLVPVDDTPALTQALARLLADKPLRERLAAEHHNRMTALTVEKMTAETVAVYKNTTQQSPTPSYHTGG